MNFTFLQTMSIPGELCPHLLKFGKIFTTFEWDWQEEVRGQANLTVWLTVGEVKNENIGIQNDWFGPYNYAPVNLAVHT